MHRKDILIIDSLASFEKIIHHDDHPYDVNMMVMPSTLEKKIAKVDPEKGIQPLRRRFNLVYLMLGGEHDVYLGADYRWVNINDLVIVPENLVYASPNYRDCTGYCVHFKTEFLQPLLDGQIAEKFPFFNPEAEHIINVTPEESTLLQKSYKDLIAEFERFSYEKDFLLRNFLYILLLRIREIYRPHVKQLKESAGRSARLANTFKHLVEKNFIDIREVQQYADKMHITPKYLSDVVKETFGKTPREIINDMVLLEAKVQLGSTSKSVSEIAFELNFTDQSHFSHFIKQRAGLSPLEFRDRFSSKEKEMELVKEAASV